MKLLVTENLVSDINKLNSFNITLEKMSIKDIPNQAQSLFKSDKFLSPLSIAIFDGGGLGEVTNIQMHAFDDSSFIGSDSSTSVDILTVEPTVLDLDFNASDTHSVNIPAEGIKVSDIFVSTLTNITAVTFFFN